MPFVTRSVGDVVAEILMSRTAFSGSLMVLEGDSDSKFFSRRLSRDHSQIVVAGGKQTVCGAVLGVYGKGQSGVLGVVDDDYDSICGVPIPSKHIVCAETRDIEVLLLASPALELVVNELGTLAKIRLFEKTHGTTVREALVTRSLVFGKLRWLDRQNAWKLKFDNCSPWRFGDVSNWAIDEVSLIAHVSQELKMLPSDLAALLAATPAVNANIVLHGRDTINVLSMGLRGTLGNQQHSEEKICQALRLAFDDAMAAGTLLFQRIKKWETENAPYRVLA